jgi:hypothetical protein
MVTGEKLWTRDTTVAIFGLNKRWPNIDNLRPLEIFLCCVELWQSHTKA